MSRGTRSTNRWTALPQSLKTQIRRSQVLTRRTAGRRITSSFLVLQSKEAQPRLVRGFLLGPQVAGPQDLGIMITSDGPQAAEHLIKVLESLPLGIEYPLRGHRTRFTALK